MVKEECIITLYNTQIDENDHIKPQALLDIFQYGAVMQSQKYKIDGPSIMHRGIIWLLVNIKVEVKKEIVKVGQKTLRTWPVKSSSKIKRLRDYELIDEDGTLIATGTSVWCIYDLKTKMPTYAKDVCFPFEDSSDRVDVGNIVKIDVQDIKNAAEPQYFSILRSYYDCNKHTNNSNYGLFIFECLDKNKTIKSFQIDFINQTFLGDKIAVYNIKNAAEPQYFAGYTNENTLIFKALVEVY